MNDDPRWQQVRAFLEWSEGNENASALEVLERWQQYTAVLDAIAADPTVSSGERSAAQGIIDGIAAEARKHTAEVLNALAAVADGPATENNRAEAQSILETALVRLRDVIDDPTTPDDVRQQAIEARRRFLAS
jgi:uncharacterized protein (UPF0147 family)